MANILEFEGKTAQDALDEAVEETGIPLSDLKFEIINQGGGGIFGLSLRKAKIRVFLPGGPEEEEAPAEPKSKPKATSRRPRRESARKARTEEPAEKPPEPESAPVAEAAPAATPPTASSAEPELVAGSSWDETPAEDEPPRSSWAQPSRQVSVPEKKRRSLSVEDVLGPPKIPLDRIDIDLRGGTEGQPQPERRPKRSSRERPEPRRRSESRRPGRPDRRPPAAVEDSADIEPVVRAAPPPVEPVSEPSEADKERLVIAEEILVHIVERIVPEAQVKGSWYEDKVYLNVLGDGSGLLIGRKGQTLDALQFLVSKILDKRTGQHVRLMVDTEDYRTRREEMLRQQSFSLANRVIRSGRSIRTGPLNPHERRVVHLALKDDKRLRTFSQGEGVYKRVVISLRGSSEAGDLDD